MMILIAAISVLAQIPTDGLVAYFPFNGNYNDESGNGLVLSSEYAESPVLTTDRFDSANNAYEFGGSVQSFKCSDATLPTGNLTISAWITVNSGHVHRTIINWGKFDVGQSNDITFYNTSHQGQQYLCITNGIDSLEVKADYSGVSQNWNHVAVTINGSSTKIFFNGELLITNEISWNIILGNYLGIGANWISEYTSGDNLGGFIDDIAIYNRTLSDSEITYLYNCNSSMNATPKFTSSPITSIKAYKPYSYNVVADDDGNISISLSKAPTGMILNNNTVEWEPTNDDAGFHTISIIATDDLGSSDTQSFELIVEPVTSISKNIVPQNLSVNNKTIVQYLPNGRIYQGKNISGLIVGRDYRRMILR